METLDLTERLSEFKRAIARDLYEPEDVVSWSSVESQLSDLESGMSALQQLIDLGRRTARDLATALEGEPKLLEVAKLILAAPGGIGFSDGRELPTEVPDDPNEISDLAHLLVEVGFWEVVTESAKVENLVRVAVLAKDSRHRRSRMLSREKEHIDNIVNGALEAGNKKLGKSLSLAEEDTLPKDVRRKAEYVIKAGESPIAVIVTVFQSRTGGRQQRDLELTYPTLQKELNEIPLALIMILDGQGIAKTPDHVLKTLFRSVAAAMTTEQAEDGDLEEALVRAAESGGKHVRPSAPLSRIIDSTLQEEDSIHYSELPTTEDEAKIALARFVENNPNLGIQLSPHGDRVRWIRSELVKTCKNLTHNFDARKAIDVFANLVGAELASSETLNGRYESNAVLKTSGNSIIPDALLVVADEGPPGIELLRKVSKEALSSISETKLSVLLTVSTDESTGWQSIQNTLPINVLVIGVNDLVRFAKSANDPREDFANLILQQADLTKVSPYVLKGVTPERMFVGREGEQATMLSTLSSNSVVLLGSRRIGKTSLMRHVRKRLGEAGYYPLFGDCQTVRTWKDFGDLARMEWDMSLPSDFKPQHLFELVRKVEADAEGKIVFLLDEIDQLVAWDKEHTSDEVDEAFFKACRTISQEGRAQFVFSGERTIAQKLWDPHSPHWNFCREVQLQQLDRESSRHLLVEPLESLQIKIEDLQKFESRSWGITSGHPQIVQFLGDSLVGLLNERSPERRTRLNVEDLNTVADTYNYREQYLTTYWGQATKLERLISLLIVKGVCNTSNIIKYIFDNKINITDDKLMASLRMLELYGIIKQEGDGYILKAEWFKFALESYGGVDRAISRLIQKIQ